MSSTTDIQQKWQKLKTEGRDLGSKEGAEQDAGYGGRIQVYENGRIYWHQTVGCFEVHGAILGEYLSRGGHGVNPLTGKRELGFPKDDETRTADGYKAVSYFEWGAIYWCYGGATLFGEIFQKYQSLGEVTGGLGYPVSSIIKTGVLSLAYFEFGCICEAPFLSVPLVINFTFPSMGNPLLAAPEDADPLERKFLCKTTLSPVQKNAIEQSGVDIINLVAGAFFKLQPVKNTGINSGLCSLSATGAISSTSVLGVAVPTLKGYLTLKTGERLSDRMLYNLCFVTANNGIKVIAPHCIYTKKNTTKFGLMHITDLHVSRRLEGMRSVLKQKGFQEGVNEFVNWNDKCRDMVKYANHLYDTGALDMILATGDLVDYVYEKNDNRKGGGNFKLFRDIILGKMPYGDDDIYAPNKDLLHEELHVPIFTTLGNHDYRPNPYELFADIDAGDIGPIDFLPGGIGDQDISSYSGLNITESEVKALQNGNKLRVDMNQAANALKADPTQQHYYRKYINPATNYVVNVGINNIIVIDSKWDLGILGANAKDILKVIFGFTNENEKDLLSVNPDSVGFEDAEINLVRTTLANANKEGTVIMGVHSPIVNAHGNEYPHYFRQTEHPTINKDLVSGYLIRRDPVYFSNHGGVANRDAPRPDWIRTGSLNFKKQDPANLLDYGTSRGKIDELIKLCLGQGVNRPVDVILCGHGHKRVEYRFGWNDEEKFFRFYTDFYTENPSEYYSSIYNEKYQTFYGVGLPMISVKEKKSVRIFVKEGANVNEQPHEFNDTRPGIYWREWSQLNVPPYSNPLSKTTNSKTWWQQHRPLMMQTAALGSGGNQRKDPSVNKQIPEPNFSGVRLLSIENNVISEMRYLLMTDLRKYNFKLPWEPASTGTVILNPPVLTGELQH